jgi:hypothetical protein
MGPMKSDPNKRLITLTVMPLSIGFFSRWYQQLHMKTYKTLEPPEEPRLNQIDDERDF